MHDLSTKLAQFDFESTIDSRLEPIHPCDEITVSTELTPVDEDGEHCKYRAEDQRLG